MIAHNENKQPDIRARELDKWLPGAALVAIGLVLLVGQVANSEIVGVLILPSLALIFIAWGIATRQVGFLIPGGILAGIGAGTVCLVFDWPFGALSDDTAAGVFLLAFAGGWASIALMSALFTDRARLWPLIPGGILAIIGTPLLIEGGTGVVLTTMGYLWPLVLVAAGLYFMFRRR